MVSFQIRVLGEEEMWMPKNSVDETTCVEAHSWGIIREFGKKLKGRKMDLGMLKADPVALQ